MRNPFTFLGVIFVISLVSAQDVRTFPKLRLWPEHISQTDRMHENVVSPPSGRFQSNGWSIWDQCVLREVKPFQDIYPQKSYYPPELDVVIMGSDVEFTKNLMANGVWKKFGNWSSLSVYDTAPIKKIVFASNGRYLGSMTYRGIMPLKDSTVYHPGTDLPAERYLSFFDATSKTFKLALKLLFQWNNTTATISGYATYTLSPDGAWACTDSVVFHYSANNKPLTIEDFRSEGGTSSLHLYEKDTLFYDTDGRVKEMIGRNSRNINDSRLTLLYTSSGKLTQRQESDWDTIQQAWKWHLNTRTQYNDRNLIDTVEWLLWDTLAGQWHCYGMDCYGYTSQGMLSSIDHYYFSGFYNTTLSKYRYQYNETGSLVEATTEISNYYFFRSVYNYTPSGLPDYIIDFSKNSSQADWKQVDSTVVIFSNTSAITQDKPSVIGSGIKVVRIGSKLRIEVARKPSPEDYLTVHSVQGRLFSIQRPENLNGLSTVYQISDMAAKTSNLLLITAHHRELSYRTVVNTVSLQHR